VFCASMFGALKRGFRSMASLILVRNVVVELRPKRTLAASRGFLAAARLSCIISRQTNSYTWLHYRRTYSVQFVLCDGFVHRQNRQHRVTLQDSVETDDRHIQWASNRLGRACIIVYTVVQKNVTLFTLASQQPA